MGKTWLDTGDKPLLYSSQDGDMRLILRRLSVSSFYRGMTTMIAIYMNDLHLSVNILKSPTIVDIDILNILYNQHIITTR